MKLSIQRRHYRSAAFSLVEMMIAVVIAASAVGVIATVTIQTSWNFAAMGNYVVMADQSRNAMDVIGREVRNSNVLLAFSTNNPTYLKLSNSTASTITTIYYDTTNNVLNLSKTGQTNALTLLKGCDSWSFSLYNRYPLFSSNSIGFYISTNINGQLDPKFTKVINMTWKCSRRILGSKLNSQSVQTAQVILRNKVY